MPPYASGVSPTRSIDSRSLSVFVLDDHRVFTDLLVLSLGMHHDLRCVAVAHTVADGLSRAAATDFDVAIIDLQLPDCSGLDAIARLRELRPHARVIVLTAHPRAALAERALAEGAVAFLAKDGALHEILDAVRHADATHPVVASALRAEPGTQVRLTPRELDVLRQLGTGQDAHRVASTLGMSVYTARDHIKSIMFKLDVRSQLDAVVTAGRLGLIDIGLGY